MRKHLIHFLLVALLSVCSAATVFAQTTVKGQVVDAESSEPMIGAAVTAVGTTQGTVTDVDGKFTLNVASNATLSIKYLGYKEFKKKILQKGQIDLGVVSLEIDAVALADVTITSSIAIARKTPVALSTIDPVFIAEKLGTQEFPEILKSTPGVYATKQGGGYGDSDITMRGFETANIAIMINGVPMNDMEWGGVYWSNWAGLSDVTRSMQTQRGLGASKVSAPSVGGSINIVTNGIEAKRGGTVSYGMGNDGMNKVLFSVSTGLTKSGWAMTVMGGKTWGDGYIQGTDFVGYNYFLNIAKRINNNHQISLTAFGAPQIHNQRNSNDGLSIQGWQEVKNYMQPGDEYKYNATYGFGKNGERKTSAKNKYHKPQISLNHMWQIDNTSSLSTALYLSIGDGWGYSGQGNGAYSNSSWYGSSNGSLNMTFRNADGTFAYDKVQEINENSSTGSQMIMSVSKNQHKWYGLLSTYTKELNDNLNFYAGIDGRYYIGTHTNEINDLYNGAYYIDASRATVSAANNSAAADPSFAKKKLGVGDVVYRDYDGYVVQEGAFAQAEYNTDKLTSFLAGSINNTSQWRYDRYYYDKAHAKSEKVNSIGFTVKGGANYNLNEYHNVFANIGYISRAPFFSGGAFLSSVSSNMVNKNAVNEKIFSAEIGYGFRSKFLTANLNIYHTEWKDKSMARSMDYKDATGKSDRAMINMTGVNATHEGIELDLKAKALSWLDITGMFSIGDWRWTNNPTGYFYNSLGQPLTGAKTVASGIGAADHAKMILLMDGVKVGGAAQTTAALGAKIKLSKDLHFGVDWNLFARNYADWAMASNDLSLGGSKTFETPWRIPSANTFDLDASYSFKIGTLPAVLSGNVNNLFDQEYISSAYDGGDHNAKSAYRVFYGFGRTMSMRLKVNF
nr:carboxypeptidase-like regulatory domain-containing protein [uncultured Bacteroides sp.]